VADLARAAWLAIVGLLVATAAASAAESQSSLPAGFDKVPLASGFRAPTQAAFAADGRIFVTEKSGALKMVRPGGHVSTLLDLRDRVNSYSDRGLLGLALDRDFARNGWLYLLYVYELQPLNPDGDGPMVSRLTRVTVRSDSSLDPGGTDGPETWRGRRLAPGVWRLAVAAIDEWGNQGPARPFDLRVSRDRTR
jgi:hypothetical protein